MSDTAVKSSRAGPRRTAGALRARLALPGPRVDVQRRQAARDRGVRRQAGRLGRLPGRDQRARRLLPAHGRRPDPGHGEGRRDRLPVPRLALGRRRQVQGDPLRAAGPAARAHPEVPRGHPQRPGDDLARRRGLRARPGRAARRSCPGVGTDAYTDWTWEVLDVPSAHCREIIDNVVDMAHFFYIHFAFPTSFRNVFEGHVATQFMESKGRPDMGGSGYGDADLVLKSEASYYGPSYMINWLWVDYKGFETEVILINCHVPTSDNSFKLQYGVCVKKPEGVDEETAQYIGQALLGDLQGGLRAGRPHLAQQGAGPEPAAVRGGRPGLPAAPLVRAVLRRQGRRRPPR